MEKLIKKDYDYLSKILLVGDSWTGKTCLFLRYFGDPNNYLEHLDNPSKCAPPTIGIGDFSGKNFNIEGKVIRLQIWDTSGIENFRSITRDCYKTTEGIIFIYDISDKDSFKHIDCWVRDFEANRKEKSIKILREINMIKNIEEFLKKKGKN